MTQADVAPSTLLVRRAVFADLEGIVRLFEGDALGGHGDHWSEATRPAYEQAMRAILMSPANRLFVAVTDNEATETGRGPVATGGVVVGTCQLTIIPGLVGQGRTRAKLESVHVAATRRDQRIGERLVRHAIEEARGAGARVMELSSNKRRSDAHRFYVRLGFAQSHEGFKLVL
jgi:ribosomal protein S18 acetylase RimI-like enzyme